MSLISFKYDKLNEINIGSILSKIFERSNLPECIVEYIGSYLFTKQKRTIKFMYEKKCDDYRTTRDTTFKILNFEYYDFVVILVQSMLLKFYHMKQCRVLPHMRIDAYYFSECNMHNENFSANKQFIIKNRILFMVLFCEVYHDFENCDTYFCLYKNNYANINQKYANYLEKIKSQIIF
jgi:hypothetical protein